MLPLQLRLPVLERLLERHLGTFDSETREIYRDGSCRHLEIRDTRLRLDGDQLRLEGAGSAQLGTALFGLCLGPPRWQGTLDLQLTPYVDENWQLHFRVTDARFSDAAGRRAAALGFLWKLSRRFLEPQLASFALDLGPPREEILTLLRASMDPTAVSEGEAILRSATLGAVSVRPSGVEILLRLQIPDRLLHTPTSVVRPEPPLTEAELAGFQRALEPWDAFLVWVVKAAGLDIGDPDIRRRLFALLISSRFRLLPLLSGEQRGDAHQAMHALFVSAWNELRAILEDAAERGLVRDRLLNYIGFIGAGDALLALGVAAPGLGLAISPDGLRSLARTLRPAGTIDPLQYDFEVDPTLRELFGFPSQQQLPWLNLPSFTRRMLGALLQPAFATEAPDAASLSKRLAHWVPKDSELEEYRALVDQLLQLETAHTLKGTDLDPKLEPVFRSLVPATAMIESCWRQFQRRGGQVLYVRSSAGSIGMMQINQYVWRGFYAIEKLKWDVAYNAGAGAEILLHYLQDYGARVARRTGTPAQAARATYSVYNAGPGAAERFLDTTGSARARRVDERLWKLYQGFAAGGKADLRACRVTDAAADAAVQAQFRVAEAGF